MYSITETINVDDFQGFDLKIHQTYVPVYDDELSSGPRCFEEFDELQLTLFKDGEDVAYGFEDVIDFMWFEVYEWEKEAGIRFDEDMRCYLQNIIDYVLGNTDVEDF